MLDSNDSESELEYLLKASYDELGLSPSTATSTCKVVSGQAELVRVASEASGIGEFWEFEDRIPSYDDSFQLGAEETRMAQETRRARCGNIDVDVVPSGWLSMGKRPHVILEADKGELSQMK
ncbi:hypothetical protein NL676_029747 [Syzygium grande]|nr:hypothetical protein NL676_029747 [Syzygium grande]